MLVKINKTVINLEEVRIITRGCYNTVIYFKRCAGYREESLNEDQHDKLIKLWGYHKGTIIDIDNDNIDEFTNEFIN